MKCLVMAVAAICLLAVGPAHAQERRENRDSTIEHLRKELQDVRRELDSLIALRESASTVSEDDLDAMESRLENRLQQLENKVDAVSRASAPTALNPRTTAFINVAARADSKTVLDATGQKEISNRPFLRTAELELRNAVDPYAEAVLVMSVENEAGRDFSIDAEEAYGLIKRLPILESAPLGLKMKIGKFRAPIGVGNKIHMHDLPWTTRPLIVSRYLGTEHGDFFESGFNPTGIDLDFFLPNPIPSTTLEMNADVVRAGDIGLALDHPGRQPATIEHLNLSRDWSNEHLLIVGLSAYQEEGDANTQLYGADVTYKWAPSEERESHSFVAGGEFYTARHAFTDSAAVQHTSLPFGWYGYLQWQTSYWLYLGGRIDWLKEPVDDRLVTRSYALYASYYTTEFLRFRLGFEHRASDIPQLDNVNTGLLEVNFVFGSHPTEPYWVNR